MDLFLKENEIEKLKICFLNNFTLGNVEIALAYLNLIAHIDKSLYEDLLFKVFDRRGFQDMYFLLKYSKLSLSDAFFYFLFHW